MEDNRVPSFVQYPQKRKRTISNNVTSPSIRAYKRHEPASFVAQSGTSLVDETKDVMRYFTNVNEEVVDTAVPLAKEKMDIEETEVVAITTTATVAASDEVKEVDDKKQETAQNVTSSSTRAKENGTATIEQKIKDDENHQSIEPTLIFLNTATKTTTTAHDDKNDEFIQKTVSKDQQQSADKPSITPAQLLSTVATTATISETPSTPNTIITSTNNITEELLSNKATTMTATTLTTHATEKQDETTNKVIQESKDTTDVQTQDDIQVDTQVADNDNDITMEINDEDAEVVVVSIQKEKDNNGNVTPDNEEDNDQESSETSTALDEPSSSSSSSSSQQKVIKEQQTPWLSSIWSTLTSPFRSKK